MKFTHSTKILLLLLLCIANITAWKGMRRFQFINNCPQTIWVGAMGNPQLSNTGWEMQPKT